MLCCLCTRFFSESTQRRPLEPQLVFCNLLFLMFPVFDVRKALWLFFTWRTKASADNAKLECIFKLPLQSNPVIAICSTQEFGGWVFVFVCVCACVNNCTWVWAFEHACMYVLFFFFLSARTWMHAYVCACNGVNMCQDLSSMLIQMRGHSSYRYWTRATVSVWVFVWGLCCLVMSGTLSPPCELWRERRRIQEQHTHTHTHQPPPVFSHRHRFLDHLNST